MSDSDLTFFTCEIDGHKHVGWFRSRGQDRLEVQTIGLLEVIELDGREPVVVARTCLEFFVRERIAAGKPISGIESDTEEGPDPYSRAPPQMQASKMSCNREWSPRARNPEASTRWKSAHLPRSCAL